MPMESFDETRACPSRGRTIASVHDGTLAAASVAASAVSYALYEYTRIEFMYSQQLLPFVTALVIGVLLGHTVKRFGTARPQTPTPTGATLPDALWAPPWS